MDKNKLPKYHSSVFFVSDVEKSKNFYTDIIGQKIEMDFGRCVIFVGGFAVWDVNYAHEMLELEKANMSKCERSNAEIYFEIEDIVALYNKIKNENVEFLHEIKEQPWCQRCFRIYDPDNHIIEFAEPMDVVIERLYNNGLSHNQIVKKTLMPIESVLEIIGKIKIVKNDRFSKDLIAACGMNCRICIGYFGYSMSGNKRKMKCIGCKPRDKSCAFLKKYCKKLTKKEVDYCYECQNFPCSHLKDLDKLYRKRYNMSMIENLESIRDNGINDFLIEQEKKYQCQECGGVICVHNGICYSCKESTEE